MLAADCRLVELLGGECGTFVPAGDALLSGLAGAGEATEIFVVANAVDLARLGLAFDLVEDGVGLQINNAGCLVDLLQSDIVLSRYGDLSGCHFVSPSFFSKELLFTDLIITRIELFVNAFTDIFAYFTYLVKNSFGCYTAINTVRIIDIGGFIMADEINLADWYDADAAAKRLSANSGKTIDNSYVRTLARYGKIRSKKLGARASLYFKADVDTYVVEERGEKSGRAKRQKAKKTSSR